MLTRAYGEELLTREQLVGLPIPAATETHQPIPHSVVANALVESLGLRQIAVVKDEYAVSKDGMKLFGVLELETTFTGCRFALGLRNSNNKTLALGITVGYRVMVCSNLAFYGDFTPLMRKHTKKFNLNDALSLGVDSVQRNFKPMVESVDRWRGLQLTDAEARLRIYEAFVEDRLDAPKHLARLTHDAYFNPPHEDFAPRTMWSLSNAFTHAFKQLDPLPLQKATASLAGFLSQYQ